MWTFNVSCAKRPSNSGTCLEVCWYQICINALAKEMCELLEQDQFQGYWAQILWHKLYNYFISSTLIILEEPILYCSSEVPSLKGSDSPSLVCTLFRTACSCFKKIRQTMPSQWESAKDCRRWNVAPRAQPVSTLFTFFASCKKGKKWDQFFLVQTRLSIQISTAATGTSAHHS